jgi:superfamily II DNA or RNA helicase
LNIEKPGMDKLFLTKHNEVYLHISCPRGIAYELRDYFSFTVPNFQYMPASKEGNWDGQIRLFNIKTGLIYFGLRHCIEEFCKKNKYEVEYDDMDSFASLEFSLKEAKEFFNSLKLPFELHEHQIDAFIHAIREKRSLLLSPTASGKTAIIYLLCSFYKKKTLIIVPNTALISQITGDFAKYGFEGKIHPIYSGQAKDAKEQIYCSTWQSLMRLPKSYFNQFELVIVDEADQAEAKCLSSILIKLTNCIYRYGLTGTLKGTKTNQLILEGLFGQIKTVATTQELIEKNIISSFIIKCVILTYPEKLRKTKRTYQNEIKFLVENESRNRFIKNLSLSVEGNTLVLFNFIKHGKHLYDIILQEIKDRPIFYVSGEIEGEERDLIKEIVDREKNAIIIASIGVFSRGINIKSLKNIIFTSPSKARRRVLQAIGRALRKSPLKDKAIIFDIVDNLTYQHRKNYTFDHFIERLKIYAEENFKYKKYNVEFKGEP